MRPSLALATAATVSLLATSSTFAGPSAGAGARAAMPPAAAAPIGRNTSATTSSSATTHTPVAKGQPNQSCGSASAPETPGHAASAPGSAFNPDGNAGTHYAGQQPQNSRNPASVAQYDVACSHQK
jgi:hypothetical protein